MTCHNHGSGEGIDQLNILLSITHAVHRVDDKDRLQALVKVWMYEALDMHDSMVHITAALFILVKKIEYRQSGLKTLEAKCDRKFANVDQDRVAELVKYYSSYAT